MLRSLKTRYAPGGLTPMNRFDEILSNISSTALLDGVQIKIFLRDAPEEINIETMPTIVSVLPVPGGP